MWGIDLQHPQVLWLLPLAAVVVLGVSWGSRAGHTRLGRYLALAVRLCWVCLCFAALAEPGTRAQVEKKSRCKLVILEDRSLSVQDDVGTSDRLIRDIVRRVPPGVDVARVNFAGSTWGASEAPVDTGQTDIENALNKANLLTMDADRSFVVLATDGRATRGNSMDAAKRLAMREGRLDVLPFGLAKPHPPRIVRVEPPVVSQIGIPGSIRVEAMSGRPVHGRVRLLDEVGDEIDRCDLTLDAKQTLLLRFTPKAAGAHSYVIELATSDAQGHSSASAPAPMMPSDRQEALVYVEGPPKLLLCDNFPEETDGLKSALEGLKVPLERITPAQWPKDLSAYAAVIISDWSGKELSVPQREALRKFVEEKGGGLVFIGGDNVMASRWQSNQVSELLPVLLREKPALVVKKPSPVSVCFVLDRSGSMHEFLASSSGKQPASKLDVVKASVLASLDALPENSAVSVVAFDDRSDIILDSVPIASKEAIIKAVESIQVGGGTSMGPAIRKGLDMLSNAKGDKYFIVLTDGITNPPGRSGFWDTVTAESKQNGISWTSIAVGDDADVRLMSELAQKAGGAYHYCDKSDQIPQVFVRAARAIKRISSLEEAPFKPVDGPSFGVLKNLPVTEMPFLRGRVRAKERDSVDVVLLTDSGEPLLSTWQFGVGKVTCFTSDAKNAWAKDWIGWPRWSTFWQQVVQGVMRPPQPFHVQVRSHLTSGGVRFQFQIQDELAKPVAGLTCQARTLSISTNGANRQAQAAKTTWLSRQAGEYEADVQLPRDDQRYMVLFQIRHPDGRQMNYAAQAASLVGPETAESGPDLTALEALATLGNGICSANPDQIATGIGEGSSRTVTQCRPLWPFLLALAILLWPIDLLIRRLA